MPSRKIKQPCPKCNFKNEPRSKYCNQCGGQLPFVSAPLGHEGASASNDQKDIAHPITQSFREYLQKRVLDTFEQEKAKGAG